MYYIYNPFYKENTFYINKKSWYFAFDYYMNAVYETLKKYINIKFIHKMKDIKKGDICLVWAPWSDIIKKLICDKIIFFNSESLYVDRNKHLIKLIHHKKIYLWIDYTYKNINFIKKSGRKNTSLVVPFLWHPLKYSLKFNYPKDIDVLFYGSTNDRRLKIKEELLKFGLKISWERSLTKDKLISSILRSKIILVVNYYEKDLPLDFYRIALPIYLKTVIVHEELQKDDENNFTKEICKHIIFTPYNQLANTCKQYIENENLEKIVNDCFDHHKENNNLHKHLPIDLIKK